MRPAGFSGGPNGVAIGTRADLAILAAPFAVAIRELDACNVAATVISGRIVAEGPQRTG